MKVAIVLPSLDDKAPINVAKEISDYLLSKNCYVVVFYFKSVVELDFNCPTKKIGLFERFNFNEFDIIHSHMIRADFYIWFQRNKIRTICVSTLHNEINKVLMDYYGLIISKIFTPLWIKFLKKQDLVICLSKHANFELNRKYNLTNSDFIYNGLTVSNGVIDSKIIKDFKRFSKNYTTLGVIANISKIKGIDQILEALVYLNEYNLIVVGSGPHLDRLKFKSKKLGISDRCLFLGYKKNAHNYLNYIDIYMLTSFSEGFPLSLLEAAQYKKAVVCSNLPIFKEFFDSSQVVFFELNDKESLINSVKFAKSNISSLSKNISKHYMKNYTSEVMGRNYFEKFNSLLQ